MVEKEPFCESEPLSAPPGGQSRPIAGRQVLFDEEGFLKRAEEWTEELAGVLAKESGWETISQTQWRIIHFLRDFYLRNGRAPMNRDIKAETEMSFMEMEALFPGGIRLGARRWAGLPNPGTC